MSEKKNLLKENTVRRFMKLAGTQAIASDFLSETYYQRDPQALAEAPEDELGPEVAPEGPEGGPPIEELPPEPEPDVALEPEDEGDEEAEEGSVEAFAKDVLDMFKDVAAEHGVDVEVEEMEEPEEIEVGDMEGEEPEEATEGELEGVEGEEEAFGAGLATGAEEGLEDEENLAEINYIDEDVLMETVYKRVANRLIKEKKADNMADMLAKKISARLDKKMR